MSFVQLNRCNGPLEEQECSICHELMKFDQQLLEHRINERAQHVFHEECLNRWIEINNKCPVCRAVLRPPEEQNLRFNQIEEHNILFFSLSSLFSSPPEDPFYYTLPEGHTFTDPEEHTFTDGEDEQYASLREETYYNHARYVYNQIRSGNTLPHREAPGPMPWYLRGDVHPIANQAIVRDKQFNFTVPENTFPREEGYHLTYNATLADGRPLPEWLNFDPVTRIFLGRPSSNDIGSLYIRVSACKGNVAASTVFTLKIYNDDPVL